jgi:hypothetical protein
MNTDEIKDLIAARRNEGVERQDIEAELKQNGVTPADMEWGFNAVQLEDGKTPPPEVKPVSPLGILLGLFFIGYGAYRLSSQQMEWDTFFGWAMITLGAIRVVITIAGMSRGA